MRRHRILLLAALLATLVGACSTASDVRGPDPSDTGATATGSTGAVETSSSPVEVSPSPGQSETPPARDGDERTRFAGRISPLPSPLAAEMRGTTWKPGCPVPLSELRMLRFNYWGFDGRVKRGPMVVNTSVAPDVLWVFGQLFEAQFPLKRVGLTREFKEARLETDPDTRRNVTASFNCRPVITPAGAGRYLLPTLLRPCHRREPAAEPVRARGRMGAQPVRPPVRRPITNLLGMIEEGDVVVRSFAAVGWAWGGNWSGGKDYMHFSLAGR